MTGVRLAGLLLVFGFVGAASGSASASAGQGLDPFRRAGASAARMPLDPIRVASPRVAEAKPASAAIRPAATGAARVAKACESDDDCPNETICEQRACQAVQASTNVLYLYYRDGTFREIAGLYWSKRGPSGYSALAPIYWHTWSPRGRSLVVAPLFWRFENYVTRHLVTVVAPLVARSSRPDSSFTWVLPLNFFWRNKDVSRQLVVPLYFRSSHPTGGTFASWLGYASWAKNSRSGAALWLYWWGSDRKTRSSYHIFFPLLWDFRDGEDRSTVVFPLVWSYGSANSDTTLAGLWFHARRATSTFETLFPVWWSGRDDKAGTAFKMLLPLLYWQQTAHGRSTLWVSPIGGGSWDDDARSRTLTLLPLLTFWRHDPARQLHIVTPLFIHHHSYEENSTTGLYAGLVYTRSDPQGTTHALLPFFWHFRDAESGATSTALLPFFARRSGPRDTTTAVGIFPLLFYGRHFKNGGWSGGIFPFAFFGDNGGRRYDVVFPLFWHFAEAEKSTSFAFPLFYERTDSHGFDRVVFPLLSAEGQHDGDSYDVLLPLFWQFASKSRQTSTTASPLGYFHRDRDGWSLGLGPILPIVYARSGATRSHFVLFPVIWHFRDSSLQRSTTVVGPFWHRSWGDETTTALFPLLLFRGGTRPGGSDETTRVLLPLFYYHRDVYTNVVVTPVGFSARGPRRSAGFFGPYFWFDNEDLHARFVPLLYADVSRRATGERTRQFGPFFALDGPGHRSRVLFPLAGHYEDDRETDTYVFPSFFRQRRTDGTRVDALVPLFWRSTGPDRSTTVVGPWYDHAAPGVHDTGFVPLWFHASNAERSLTVILPLLFFHDHDFKSDEERLLLALLWHSSGPSGSSTTLFPVWWAGSAAGKRHAVVFPIFWHFADSTAKTSWSLMGPLYWSAHGTARTFGLLPVLWHSWDPSDESGATGLMPLLYESHGPKRGTFMTALFGWHNSPTSRFAYAGPLVPLWISHTAVATETHTTLIPPLLLYTKSSPDAGLTTFAGLFWRHHDVTSSTTLALPLYYDFHDFDLSRTTVAFPLLFRHANEVAGTVTWLAPLFYSHSTPAGSTTLAFPLYWDFASNAARTTLLIPFLARWRRPDHISTWVFPTIYHRTGLGSSGQPDGTWQTVVAPFYAAAVKRPGDFMWEVLGGLFGHESAGRNRYLKLFFMRFEQQPVPRAQTAWYSQPVRAPRRQPVRGLSMNSW